jgi:hypothetical protein
MHIEDCLHGKAAAPAIASSLALGCQMTFVATERLAVESFSFVTRSPTLLRVTLEESHWRSSLGTARMYRYDAIVRSAPRAMLYWYPYTYMPDRKLRSVASPHLHLCHRPRRAPS